MLEQVVDRAADDGEQGSMRGKLSSTLQGAIVLTMPTPSYPGISQRVRRVTGRWILVNHGKDCG